jgi:hypothetical protein
LDDHNHIIAALVHEKCADPVGLRGGIGRLLWYDIRVYWVVVSSNDDLQLLRFCSKTLVLLPNEVSDLSIPAGAPYVVVCASGTAACQCTGNALYGNETRYYGPMYVE